MKDKWPKLASNLRIDEKIDMKKWQKCKNKPLQICQNHNERAYKLKMSEKIMLQIGKKMRVFLCISPWTPLISSWYGSMSRPLSPSTSHTIWWYVHLSHVHLSLSLPRLPVCVSVHISPSTLLVLFWCVSLWFKSLLASQLFCLSVSLHEDDLFLGTSLVSSYVTRFFLHGLFLPRPLVSS